MKSPADYRELLRAGRWFRNLSSELQDQLLSAATLKRFSPNQTVMARGQPRAGLFGVLEGAIRVGGSTEAGDQSLLVLAEPPTWFGEIALIDGGPMTHDAVVVRAALVVFIPAARLDQLAQQDPAWWRELARLMAIKVRLLFDTLEEQALLPASAQLARRLVLMAEGYGGWTAQTSRVLEVSQEQLATMLAVSRQTVNQVLKTFEAAQLVRVCYAGLEILDLPGLKHASGEMLLP